MEKTVRQLSAGLGSFGGAQQRPFADDRRQYAGAEVCIAIGFLRALGLRRIPASGGRRLGIANAARLDVALARRA